MDTSIKSKVATPSPARRLAELLYERFTDEELTTFDGLAAQTDMTRLRGELAKLPARSEREAKPSHRIDERRLRAVS